MTHVVIARLSIEMARTFGIFKSILRINQSLPLYDLTSPFYGPWVVIFVGTEHSHPSSMVNAMPQGFWMLNSGGCKGTSNPPSTCSIMIFEGSGHQVARHVSIFACLCPLAALHWKIPPYMASCSHSTSETSQRTMFLYGCANKICNWHLAKKPRGISAELDKNTMPL